MTGIVHVRNVRKINTFKVGNLIKEEHKQCIKDINDKIDDKINSTNIIVNDKVFYFRYKHIINILIAKDIIVIAIFSLIYLILTILFEDMKFTILLSCCLIIIFNLYLKTIYDNDDTNNENKDKNK